MYWFFCSQDCFIEEGDHDLPSPCLLLHLWISQHQAAIQTVFSGITFSWGNWCISGKHMGMAHPPIMLEGLSPGEKQCLLKYKPLNWDEPFQPDRYKSLFSSVTWRKNVLSCYEDVSIASDLCWTIWNGQSGWSSASARPTWALEQAQAPLTPGKKQPPQHSWVFFSSSDG